MSYTVKILGSGSSLGVPVLGCHCTVCTSVLDKNKRFRSSLLVTNAGKNILIDTGPDIKEQLIQSKINTIDAIIITHPHSDHCIGLDELRSVNIRNNSAIDLYVDQVTLTILKRIFPYLFAHNNFNVHLITNDEIQYICGLEVEFLKLIHGKINNLGIKIGSFAYLNDYTDIPDESMEKLYRIKTLILDSKEYKDTRAHIGVYKALGWFYVLRSSNNYLINLSHKLCYELLTKKLPNMIKLSFDGMILNL